MNFFELVLQLAQGLGYTLLVTLCCSLTGCGVGLCVAGLRRIGLGWLTVLLDVYAYVFRGIPVLVLLFIVYFGLPSLGLKVSPLMAMVLSLGLISSAYLAEVFRGGLNSVDESEILAAQAMGFSRLQLFKWIELPQMARFCLPGVINEFTTVLKYSPFAYTVGIPEITKQAMTLSAASLHGVEIYTAVGLIYFLIFRILLLLVQYVERRYRIPGLVMKQHT